MFDAILTRNGLRNAYIAAYFGLRFDQDQLPQIFQHKFLSSFSFRRCFWKRRAARTVAAAVSGEAGLDAAVPAPITARWVIGGGDGLGEKRPRTGTWPAWSCR